jgi:hypothetical protein
VLKVIKGLRSSFNNLIIFSPATKGTFDYDFQMRFTPKASSQIILALNLNPIFNTSSFLPRYFHTSLEHRKIYLIGTRGLDGHTTAHLGSSLKAVVRLFKGKHRISEDLQRVLGSTILLGSDTQISEIPLQNIFSQIIAHLGFNSNFQILPYSLHDLEAFNQGLIPNTIREEFQEDLVMNFTRNDEEGKEMKVVNNISSDLLKDLHNTMIFKKTQETYNITQDFIYKGQQFSRISSRIYCLFLRETVFETRNVLYHRLFFKDSHRNFAPVLKNLPKMSNFFWKRTS